MQRRRNRRALVWIAPLAAAGALLAAPAVRAEGDAGDAPLVELDKLLKLPSDLPVETELRGGMTRAEWRARFAEARRDVSEARKNLERTRARLEDVASETSTWQMGAPGLGNVESRGANEGPLDYALSNEMRNNRQELERSERRLMELGVEANLAGVPEEWRGDPEAEPPAAAQERE